MLYVTYISMKTEKQKLSHQSIEIVESQKGYIRTVQDNQL